MTILQKKLPEIFNQLVKGYQKVRGQKPTGLDLIKIKQEAMLRFQEMRKVLDMQRNPIDPNKPRLLNTQDAKISKSKSGKVTVVEPGVKGDFGRRLRDMIIAGGTATFGGTDIGRSLMNRVSNALGGAAKGAGQGFMKDPQSKDNNNNQPGIYQAPDGTIRVR